MKTSELNKLTQIVEHLVALEVRKQLPGLIAEALQNRNGKSSIVESVETPEPVVAEESDLKASLRELFAGTGVMPTPVKTQKRYAKDDVLNQILSETVPDLRSRERMVGAAAFHGGYAPGQMDVSAAPTGAPLPMREGQEGGAAPMATVPAGVSVLDLKNQISDPSLKRAFDPARMKAILAKSKGK